MPIGYQDLRAWQATRRVCQDQTDHHGQEYLLNPGGAVTWSGRIVRQEEGVLERRCASTIRKTSIKKEEKNEKTA
jgi:hypothetical protein